ncbi:hypothetical protein ENBRE01_2693 [Enteropsectra breve]|nr:hypothetical protein ENBRE01_2221 [Enteropsectra breve]KAI5152265.1 hypothetical protein ENBRE01_2693 [Enteropsectra breve]
MSALFKFESFLKVLALFICLATYIKRKFPSLVARKEGFSSILYKASVAGDRLSPFIALACLFFAAEKLIKCFI